jgi:hypothetical protein
MPRLRETTLARARRRGTNHLRARYDALPPKEGRDDSHVPRALAEGRTGVSAHLWRFPVAREATRHVHSRAIRVKVPRSRLPDGVSVVSR